MGCTPMKGGVLHVELLMKSLAKNDNMVKRFKGKNQRTGIFRSDKITSHFFYGHCQ